MHTIFLIKCSPVSSFRQFVYHIFTFSTFEFGIQFLISCILSSCHWFLSICLVFSVVSQVFCCSTALQFRETIYIPSLLFAQHHSTTRTPFLHTCHHMFLLIYIFRIVVNHVANFFPCGFFLLLSSSHNLLVSVIVRLSSIAVLAYTISGVYFCFGLKSVLLKTKSFRQLNMPVLRGAVPDILGMLISL